MGLESTLVEARGQAKTNAANLASSDKSTKRAMQRTSPENIYRLASWLFPGAVSDPMELNNTPPSQLAMVAQSRRPGADPLDLQSLSAMPLGPTGGQGTGAITTEPQPQTQPLQRPTRAGRGAQRPEPSSSLPPTPPLTGAPTGGAPSSVRIPALAYGGRLAPTPERHAFNAAAWGAGRQKDESPEQSQSSRRGQRAQPQLQRGRRGSQTQPRPQPSQTPLQPQGQLQPPQQPPQPQQPQPQGPGLGQLQQTLGKGAPLDGGLGQPGFSPRGALPELAYGGRMADGGEAGAGDTALVGEEGPEIALTDGGEAGVVGAGGPEVTTVSEPTTILPNPGTLDGAGGMPPLPPEIMSLLAMLMSSKGGEPGGAGPGGGGGMGMPGMGGPPPTTPEGMPMMAEGGQLEPSQAQVAGSSEAPQAEGLFDIMEPAMGVVKGYNDKTEDIASGGGGGGSGKGAAPGLATSVGDQGVSGVPGESFRTPGEAITGNMMNFLTNPGQLNPIAYERAQADAGQSLNACRSYS